MLYIDYWTGVCVGVRVLPRRRPAPTPFTLPLYVYIYIPQNWHLDRYLGMFFHSNITTTESSECFRSRSYNIHKLYCCALLQCSFPIQIQMTLVTQYHCVLSNERIKGTTKIDIWMFMIGSRTKGCRVLNNSCIDILCKYQAELYNTKLKYDLCYIYNIHYIHLPTYIFNFFFNSYLIYIRIIVK